MNRQQPLTGIGWTDFTWNPVRGCKGRHAWCYARALAKRFRRSFVPSFHSEELGEPARQIAPARIFVCSTGDLWGPWVPAEWQRAVLEAAAAAPWHTYQFLTHYPEDMARRMRQAYFLAQRIPNRWMGASVHGAEDMTAALFMLNHVCTPVRFLSVEPILAPSRWEHLATSWINWVIIGALTGKTRPKTYKQLPPAEVGRWALDLARAAKAQRQAVYLKRNLWQEGCLPREVVEGLQEFPDTAGIHRRDAEGAERRGER